MFKRFNKFDKQLVEYEFNSGSSGRIPFANMQDVDVIQNVEPYDDNNELKFGLRGSRYLPEYFNETSDFDMIASASATFGQIKNLIGETVGKERRKIFGSPDHYIRCFTSFHQNERTQVPMVWIVPNNRTALYDLPGSSFTVEIKYFPEKAGGPNDDLCNLTLTGSTSLSKSFIDSDLISFLSISQDNTVHRNYPDDTTMGTGTASFHYRFAGDKAGITSNLTSFQAARPRFYGNPKPVLEIIGLSGSEGAFSDKFPASLSRDDPGKPGIDPAWKRPGVVSGSTRGMHLSCSQWHYSYISWRTGSRAQYTSSLKFDKYGKKNGFIGGVVNYTRNDSGAEHFATYSVADPGQINNNITGSLWTNVTGSHNFRKLGNKLGMIQLGGRLTPGPIIYHPSKGTPSITQITRDVHQGTAGGVQPSISGSNPYYGGIKELRIWNAALDHNTLATWSLKELDGTHPYLHKLAGYWKFDFDTLAAEPDVTVVGKGRLTNNVHGDFNFPTGSYVNKTEDQTTENHAFFLFQPQSGSGYLPNNDSSSFTAMNKVVEFPPWAPKNIKYINLTDKDAEITYVRRGFPLTANVPNYRYYTHKDNPFKIINAKKIYAGSRISTGSVKISFDTKRIATTPVISGPIGVGSGVQSFGHADFVPADGNPNVDRDGGNKVIRPSMYTLPRGKKLNNTASFTVDWVDNGSGSIYPPLNYTNKENNPCGIVSYANGIIVFRDATYDGLHNLYVYSASAFPYPTGALEIEGSGKKARAEYAATASGFYKTEYFYSGTLDVKRLQLNCRANFNEFNASTNRTFAKAFKDKKISSSLDHTGSVTYITGIGLYDDDGNLIGVGKLSKPLRKEMGQSITTKLRLDL